VIPWERAGDTVTTKIDRQEAAVLRGMVGSIEEMLQARQAEAPQDELTALTGIRTGPTTAPDDPIMARLLPDFHRLDDEDAATQDHDSAAALRSLHEPELLDLKTGVAGVLLDTCPPAGGKVTLSLEQADAWLSTLNDVRLALGITLGVSEDMPDELPDDDPRAPHLGVYHWLTWMQESLVTALTEGDE
jgi:nitroreductase